jgi:hypothetical protein
VADDWYYLLRVYDMRLVDAVAIDSYLRDAFLPAVKRLGVGSVGVFTGWAGEQSLTGRYVIMGSESLHLLANLDRALAQDDDHERLGAGFLAADSARPPFVRLKSSLIRALPGLPRLHTPPALAGQPGRLFELRTYEQPTYETHLRKSRMFIEVEHDMLARAGFNGVMYGQDLIGERLPRVTYLWCYPDLAARQRAEEEFFSDAAARAMFQDPRWAGVPSAIANTIIRPTPYSDL